MAIIDIDDFKNVNDTYGHNCGDYVLKKIAEIIKVSDEYVPCRWGGEEFILIGKSASDMDHINELMNRLREAIAKTDFVYEDNRLKITITIGIEEHTQDITIENWISRTDEKLYHGKKSGKNVVIY